MRKNTTSIISKLGRAQVQPNVLLEIVKLVHPQHLETHTHTPENGN